MPIHKEYNKDYFKKWSNDMAYILGFMFADGNIIKTKRGTHFVSIYTSDFELLFEMSKSMKSGHKISKRISKTGVVYRVQIGSKEIFYDLIKIGLTPNKSKRMRLPNIPKKYIGSYIRGYFDGDGNVWMGDIHKDRLKEVKVLQVFFTCASIGYLEDLHRVLVGQGIIGGSVYKSKKGNFGRLSFGTHDSLKIHKIMYNGDTSLVLVRKRLVFERFIQMRS